MDSDIEMETEKKISKVERNHVTPRRTLADISNLPQQHHVVKPNALSKEYLERLQKENMVLKKALTDRTKIIELSEVEIQKLRVNLQIMQHQNAQLAQANSQMLADLNSGKDRLKLLQHELGCKNALLKMRNLEREENAKDRICNFKEPKLEIAEASKLVDKPCGTRKKQRSKSQSLGATADPVQVEESADSKRQCKRRQSARFRMEETSDADKDDCSPKHAVQVKESVESKRQCKRRQSARFRMEEPLDIDKDNCSSQHGATTNENPLSDSSIKKENEEEKNTPGVDNQVSRRSSIARPLRRAVERVQSYKEIPLNVKMRRAS